MCFSHFYEDKKMTNEIITIEYKTSVYLPKKGVWRSETVIAKARKINEKMAEVIEVLELGGEEAKGYISRTGSKSQVYNASGIAAREVGAKKRLSACEVIESKEVAACS